MMPILSRRLAALEAARAPALVRFTPEEIAELTSATASSTRRRPADFWTETSNPIEIRCLEVMCARAVGPVIGGVRFTTAGFHAYLAYLLSSS